jgi:hypothetical protein
MRAKFRPDEHIHLHPTSFVILFTLAFLTSFNAVAGLTINRPRIRLEQP